MDLNEDRDKRSVSSATEEQPNQICMAGVIWHPIDGPRIVGMHKFREIHRGVDCLIFTYCEKGEGRGGSGLCWVDCEGLDIDNADDQFKWYKALIESGWANPNYFKAKGRVVMDNVQYPATQTKCVWELDGSEKEQESKIRRWPAAKEYQYFLYMARRSGSKDMIYYRRPAQPEYKMITDTFLGPHGVSSSKKAAAKKSPGQALKSKEKTVTTSGKKRTVEPRAALRTLKRGKILETSPTSTANEDVLQDQESDQGYDGDQFYDPPGALGPPAKDPPAKSTTPLWNTRSMSKTPGNTPEQQQAMQAADILKKQNEAMQAAMKEMKAMRQELAKLKQDNSKLVEADRKTKQKKPNKKPFDSDGEEDHAEDDEEDDEEEKKRPQKKTKKTKKTDIQGGHMQYNSMTTVSRQYAEDQIRIAQMQSHMERDVDEAERQLLEYTVKQRAKRLRQFSQQGGNHGGYY